MGRPVEYTDRLSRLIEARKLFDADIPVTLLELAKAAGVSERRLGVEIKDDPNFPPHKFGRPGVPSEINVLTAIDYMIAKCEAGLAAKTERADKIVRLTGLPANSAPSGGAYSILELSKAVDVTLKLDDAKRRQGVQCDVQKSSTLYVELVQTTLNGLMGITHAIDPTNLLPVDVREAVNTELRGLASQIKADSERRIAEFANSDGGGGRG